MPTIAALTPPATTRRPPGPPGVPVLGNALQVIRDPLTAFMSGVRDYGDTIYYRLGPFPYVVINRPEDVRHVLVRNRDNYPKSRSYAGLKLFLGRGLLTSEGQHWKTQRKLAQPAFHRKRLAGFAQAMAECTGDMLERWQSLAQPGRRFDVHEEMMRVTFRIVGHTLFSADLENDAADVGRALTEALHFATRYPEKLIPPPLWIPTPGNVRFKRARATLDSLVFRLIQQRRDCDSDDLLGMLANVRTEDGQPAMSDQQLRDEVMTLVLAGHETTANALTWTLMLLSQHPAIARQVRAEVEAVLGDRRDPTPEDVRALALTTRVIQESMRLYPPAWMVERQATEADVLDGYPIAPGTQIGICAYALHRHPRYWRNPEGFDPDRFLPDRVAQRPADVYLPFGMGPRRCIGSHFAMMESVIMLAMIVRRYRLSLVPGHPVVPEAAITLRPRHGLLMTAEA